MVVCRLSKTVDVDFEVVNRRQLTTGTDRPTGLVRLSLAPRRRAGTGRRVMAAGVHVAAVRG